MSERDINQRVIEFIEYRKFKYSDVAKILGVANQRIEQWKKNERPIGPEYLQTLCLKFIDLNANWLLTGKGKMLNDAEENSFEYEAQYPIQSYKNCIGCEAKDAHIKDLQSNITKLNETIAFLLGSTPKKDKVNCG